MSNYNMNDFGAVGDEKTINTEAIQRAIDTASKNGGGRVIFERGIYQTGSFILKSNVELYLEHGCKISGSPDLNDYREMEGEGFAMDTIEPKKEITKHALILASGAENISIRGYGEINGNGLAFYRDSRFDPKQNKFEKPDIPRPRIAMFYRCKNVSIEIVSFVDSPCWTFWLMKCENVRINGIRISGDKRMRNVDGIDIDSCRDVIVNNCLMDTEDDCISLRAFQNFYDTPAICENITITNCIFNTSCNGIRIGCPSDGEIKNCIFSNLFIKGTNGIISQHPKRYFYQGSKTLANIHDLIFNSIIIESKHIPIWLYIEDDIKIEKISDMVFSNIKIKKSNGPITIKGSRETIIRNIVFDNVAIENPVENCFVITQSENITFDRVSITSKKP